MWPSRSFFHLRIATEGGASSGAQERLLPIYLHINEKDLEWFRGKREEIVPSVCELVSEAIQTLSSSLSARAPRPSPRRRTDWRAARTASSRPLSAKRPRCDIVSLDVGTGGGAALNTSSFVLKLYVFPLETEANDINQQPRRLAERCDSEYLSGIIDSSRDNGDPRLLRVALDWTPNSNHGGFYVAQAQGFYAAEGITVEIVPPSDKYDKDETPARSVVSGRADLCVAPTESVLSCWTSDHPANTRPRCVATLLQRNTSAIVALKSNAAIKCAADLAGKRYASYEGRFEMAIVNELITQGRGEGEAIEVAASQAGLL